MPLKEFSCKKCGNCCLNLSDAFSTCADEKDIERWEKKGRSDILEWVAYLPLGDNFFIKFSYPTVSAVGDFLNNNFYLMIPRCLCGGEFH